MKQDTKNQSDGGASCPGFSITHSRNISNYNASHKRYRYYKNAITEDNRAYVI